MSSILTPAKIIARTRLHSLNDVKNLVNFNTNVCYCYSVLQVTLYRGYKLFWRVAWCCCCDQNLWGNDFDDVSYYKTQKRISNFKLFLHIFLFHWISTVTTTHNVWTVVTFSIIKDILYIINCTKGGTMNFNINHCVETVNEQ